MTNRKSTADEVQVEHLRQHAAAVVTQESDTAGRRCHVVQSPCNRLYHWGSVPAASYSAAQRTGAWSPAGYGDAVLAGCQDLRRAMTHLGDAAPLVEWVVLEEVRSTPL